MRSHSSASDSSDEDPGQLSHQNIGKEQQAAKQSEEDKKHDDKQPAGGYDSTKIPHAPPGYDVRIIFHRATHLPIADLHTMSSDPYIDAEIRTHLPGRHREDPHLHFRSPTVFDTTEPVWDAVWQLAHVPADGFHLKVRIYDEDANDKDDRLGNAHITVGRIDEDWEGIDRQPFDIQKRSGSKRAYLLRAMAVATRQAHKMEGDLYVSIECLGRSKGKEGGRTYTTGPNYWYRHYSPMLGRAAGTRAPNEDTDSEESSEETQNGQAPDGEVAGNPTINGGKKQRPPMGDRRSSNKSSKSSSNGKSPKKGGKYRFQANQFQLAGPVPAELYHRYVDFKPIISSLFTNKGLRGLLLAKALHHQHGMVYNFSESTKHGVFEHPCEAMSRQFLDLVHHDEGGRIHTYVITLDGMMRFTETGKEFGIDFLSKHTMHSDASIYIAYSGEFFIRRLKNPHEEPPEHAQAEASHDHSLGDPNRTTPKHGNENISHDQATNGTCQDTHPPHQVDGGPPKGDPPSDPRYYELIIDNDSGTYRPNAQLLPILAGFLRKNFPGIKITTLDCQADAELMGKLKDQQRERKKAEGNQVVFTQYRNSSSSGLSGSDEERLQEGLDAQAQGEQHKPHGFAQTILPFVGSNKAREGLKGNLGFQRKGRKVKNKA